MRSVVQPPGDGGHPWVLPTTNRVPPTTKLALPTTNRVPPTTKLTMNVA
jgi:hypothetical protein